MLPPLTAWIDELPTASASIEGSDERSMTVPVPFASKTSVPWRAVVACDRSTYPWL